MRKGYWKGKKRSEETRLKISIGNKGKHKELKPHLVKLNKLRIGIPLSEEHRRKLSESKKGKKYSPRTKKTKYRKGYNKFWLGKHRSEETKQKMREARIKNPNRVFKDTKIELAIEAELIKQNINYQKQVPLCKVALVDFYLPEYRIVIQCDGCYWHKCPIHFPNSKKGINDENQDRILTFNGFNVYRFWEHEINESPEKCIRSLKIIPD